MSTQSRYACIWDILKKDKFVRISAPAERHKRLRQAVMKRKAGDLGHRYLMKEQNLRAHLSFVSEGNVLTIKLHLSAYHLWL